MEHLINLNFAPGGLPATVHVSQYDDTIRQLRFQLWFGRSKVEVPSGASVRVDIKKPDGHIVLVNGTVNSSDRSIVTVPTTKQMTAAPGGARGTLVVSSTGDKRISSAIFILHVHRDPVEDGDASDSDLSMLQDAIDQTAANASAAQAAATAAQQAASSFTTDTTLSVSGKAADAAETGRQFGLIKADLGAMSTSTVISDYSIESGSIHTDTGADMNNLTNRCRTGFISFNGEKMTVAPKSGYKVTSRIYADATIGSYEGHGDFTEGTIELTDSTKYYRFVIGAVDDSTISPSSLPEDVISILDIRYTDATLSESGKSADAAETGARIQSLRNDLSNVEGDLPNLFWVSNTISRTEYGVTRTYHKDGTVTFNGTATQTFNIGIMGAPNRLGNNIEAGTYIFDRQYKGDGSAPTRNPYFHTDEGSILLGIPKTFDGATNVHITIGNGYVFNNYTYSFSIRKEGKTAVDETARQITPKKTIKILGIGNSYTRDSTRWLSKILAEAGYENVIVGQAYIGSITLAEQYASLDASHSQYSSYTYYKFINNGVRNQQAGKTLVEVINDEDWDVVVFQQQSDESGQYASFVSNDFDINDFIAYVKTAISNDSLKVGLVLPWSHATGYVGDKFEEYYNSVPAVQFTAIKTVIPQVANHMSQCDFIVNAGDAVDFGRKNEYLAALGVEMLRTDKNHLQYGIPSYMVGLVYAMTICGLNGTESTWYPTSADEGVECVTSANLARLARICAKNAVLAVN